MVPASDINIHPVAGSHASSGGTTSGLRSASSATSGASWASAGAVALNHTSPASVGTRITVDHVRTWGCSIAPAGVSPSSPSRAPIHVCAAATHSGSSHRSVMRAT
jgi:hypothetical protein